MKETACQFFVVMAFKARDCTQNLSPPSSPILFFAMLPTANSVQTLFLARDIPFVNNGQKQLHSSILSSLKVFNLWLRVRGC